MNYLLLLAILPTFLMGRYIYNNDRIEKEPTNLLVKLMASGILAAILTVILTAILTVIFPFFGNANTESFDPMSLAVYVFFGIALIEEFSKWFFTTILSWKNKNFNHIYDAIVYSTFVSLGFATIENILYVFANETVAAALGTAILRMLLSVPGHTFFGVMMGYYLGLAKLTAINNKKNKSQKYLVLSLLVPATCHFLFDYLLLLGEPISFLLFLAFIVCLFTFGVSRVKRMSTIPTMLFGNSPNYNLPPSNFNYNYYPNNNVQYNNQTQNLNPNSYLNNNNIQVPNSNSNNYITNNNYKPKYCSNCGAPVTGPYCSNCGKKLF